MTNLPDEVELELSTVEYDYRVHPEAMERIRLAVMLYLSGGHDASPPVGMHMNNDIDLTWHSTPQLWIAMRHGVCGCHECNPPFGMGKTKEAAIAALVEWEKESLDGDSQ